MLAQSVSTNGCSFVNSAANFIQKNPNQIQKTTVGNENKEDIPIQFFDVEEYSTKYMLKILKHIPIGHEKKKVYFLARSNFSLDNTIKNENVINNSFKKNINWKELQKSRPDLTIHKDTIHGAKGLEKDIVIILGNDSGSKGFPPHIPGPFSPSTNSAGKVTSETEG